MMNGKFSPFTFCVNSLCIFEYEVVKNHIIRNDNRARQNYYIYKL